MTREEKVAEFERMLAKVPDVMSPLKASKCSPFGKNKIYELIKAKELRAFVFQGSYIIAKVDLIETIVDHSDREGRTYMSLAEASIFEYAFKLGMQIAIETLTE